MPIWSAEIKELETLYISLKGKLPGLEKELERLIKAEDENMILLYSRRCLEVIITDLCESELNRPRKTEPLKGIIDKLNREEKVPSHIITSMQSLNSMSTYGAHPKEFDPEQLKPVLSNLNIVIKWYLKYKTQKTEVTVKEKEEKHEPERPGEAREPIPVVKSKNKPIIIISGILLIGVIIILALDVFNLFHKDKFKDIRNPEGRISIAVMPFQNMTNDTLWNIWQEGIQNELITNLSNSTELSVHQYQTMLNILQSTGHTNYASITPSIASDLSRKLQANTFIQGSIKSAGEKIRVNAHLIDAYTEEIYRTFQIDGNSEDDIFHMIDSLSGLVRNYLEIKVLGQDADYEIRTWATTDSPEAYRYYIQGMNLFFESDYSSAIALFNKALETDTNFFAARMYLTISFFNLGKFEEARLSTQKAYEQIENATYTEQLLLKSLKSLIDKDQQAFIKYTKLVLDNDPQARIVWYQQGLNYYRIYQYEKAIQCLEKALEIDKQWGGGWKWVYLYTVTGEAYHELGDHQKEKEIYELGLSILPDHPKIIYLQAVCALSQGETTEANDYIEKYRLIRETESREEYWINYSIGEIYLEAEQFDKATDIFRDLIAKDPQNTAGKWALGFILIEKDININEGMELIDQALKSTPDNVDYISIMYNKLEPNVVQFLYAKGLGHYKEGKIEEAHQLLKEAWEKRPLYDHDHYLLLQEVEQALTRRERDE